MPPKLIKAFIHTCNNGKHVRMQIIPHIRSSALNFHVHEKFAVIQVCVTQVIAAVIPEVYAVYVTLLLYDFSLIRISFRPPHI